MSLKQLYFVEVCEDEIGEVGGVFDDFGNLLHYWSLNDAQFRTEYMEPLLQQLGYTCGTRKRGRAYERHIETLERKLVEQVSKDWGIENDIPY